MSDEPVYDQVAARHVDTWRDLFIGQVRDTINALPEATAWEDPSWT